MAPRRKTSARRGEKIRKNRRPGRPCPHCGQIQPGEQRTAAPRKPSGLRIRKAKKRQEAGHSSTAGQHTAPEPIDAKTIIKGIVEGVPVALQSMNGEADLSTAALNAAVRKAVLDEFRTRAQFAGRLAETDALVWAQADHGGELLGGALREHLRELRILRVTEPEESDRFVVTEGEGEAFEVLRPAYVDELTGKVIMAGHLRRVPAPDTAMGEEG